MKNNPCYDARTISSAISLFIFTELYPAKPSCVPWLNFHWGISIAISLFSFNAPFSNEKTAPSGPCPPWRFPRYFSGIPKSKILNSKAKTRNQKSKSRKPKSKTRNPKPEIQNPEIQNPKCKNPKSQTRNPNSQNPNPEIQNLIQYPKPETQNPKSKTRNPKPEIPNAKPIKPKSKIHSPTSKIRNANPKSNTQNPKPEIQISQIHLKLNNLCFLVGSALFLAQWMGGPVTLGISLRPPSLGPPRHVCEQKYFLLSLI